MTAAQETASRINFGVAEVEVLHPKFIAQVRAACEMAIQEAVAEEREACACIADPPMSAPPDSMIRAERESVAMMIRERKDS